LGAVDGAFALALEDLDATLAKAESCVEECLREHLLFVQEFEVIVVDLPVDLVGDELARILAIDEGDVLVCVFIVIETLLLLSSGRRDGLVAGFAHSRGGLVVDSLRIAFTL
jgi:hypothetical protein